jgi:putative inorganic carbon (HCO3(-)) transporter
MNKQGVNIGLLLTGISVSLLIVFLSLYKYLAGIYTITVMGFVIFTLGRLIYMDIPWGTALELLIFITTLGMLVSQKIKNNQLGPFFRKPFVIVFSIYLLYVIISVVNPAMNSKLGWISEFKRFFSLYCFFLLIYIGLDNIKDHYRYGRLLLILCAIAALYGCYQQFFGFADFEMNYIVRSEARRKLLFMISGVKRKFSLFSDPSSFGITMAASASILLSMIANSKLSKKTVIYSILLVLSLMGLAFSGTRTAYLAFAAGAGFFILLTVNKVATRIMGILLLAGFAFIMIVPIYSNPTLNRVRSAFDLDNEASLNVRDVNRKSVQPYMLVHPFGGGLGTTGGSGVKYNPGHFLAGFATDSGYLQTSTELGWIGLILLLVQYYLIFREGLNVYFNTDKKDIKRLIACCLVCIFTFVISQYAQVAVGQFPDSFLFYGAAAIIFKTSLNLSQNKTT